MKRAALRKLARTNPEELRRVIVGARERELTARHLLLDPEKVATASEADLAALREYIADKRWQSLYGHDRAMYRLLRAAVEKLKSNETQKSKTTHAQVVS